MHEKQVRGGVKGVLTDTPTTVGCISSQIKLIHLAVFRLKAQLVIHGLINSIDDFILRKCTELSINHKTLMTSSCMSNDDV